jgi:hypothetical protein
MSVEDARAQLVKRLDDIDARRRAHGEVCEACSGRGYVAHALGPGTLGWERRGLLLT